MGRLFSSFDPRTRIFSFSLRLNWASTLSPLLFFPPIFWITRSQFIKSLKLVLGALIAELMAVLHLRATPGILLIFLSFFIFIFFSNFLGLFPYVFTASSHLSFTLALSLPLWLGSMIWSIFLQTKRVIAHLVPLGTPAPLIPAIVVIESVRSLIRPLTLAVRLAANIIAGHLLLALLGGQGRLSLSIGAGLILIALVGLLILECAVACIQSYVFTILRTLYLNELIRRNFSKKFLF